MSYHGARGGDSALQWSRDLSVAETPWSGVGKVPIFTLQWSRDLSVAETVSVGTAHYHQRPPSMEPRPFSRGNERSISITRLQKGPSMEPRPFSRGNLRCLSGCESYRSPLQWSRDLSVAETSCQAGALFSSVCLQWSRDLSVAETPREGARACHRVLPSMEPRPFSRGNASSSCPPPLSYLPFNGAATFQSRKPAATASR